nr:GNAT family N-acetyltransferase [Nocardioides luti]
MSDPDVVRRACTASGVVTRVALDPDGRVVGFAQACGDGEIQSFLAQLAVLASHRRQGIARRLVEDAFAATGTQRMDLVTDDAEAFYASFPHRTKPGFRIYPGGMLGG